MTLTEYLKTKKTREIVEKLGCDRITAWRLRRGIKPIGRRELAIGALAWPTGWDVVATLAEIADEYATQIEEDAKCERS